MSPVLITKQLVSEWLPTRSKTSYKGDFGHALLIGGNEAMGGAIQMAGQAAVYGGSGLTTIASADVNRAAIHSALPEAMFIDWEDPHALEQALAKTTILTLGPGMGRDSKRWARLLPLLTNAEVDTVMMDGDALFFYSQSLKRGEQLFQKSHVILTPHLGEWHTLTQGRIPSDDFIRIQQWVDQTQVTLVLKGAPSRIFFPEQETYFENTTGNPGQAIGGMGDTLVGTITALAGQIARPERAAAAGVYIHSSAADTIYRDQYVVVPTVLAHQLPYTMKQLARRKTADVTRRTVE